MTMLDKEMRQGMLPLDKAQSFRICCFLILQVLRSI